MISRRGLFRLIGGGTLLALVPKAAPVLAETVTIAPPLSGPTASVLALDAEYFRQRYIVPAMKALWDEHDRQLLALFMDSQAPAPSPGNSAD